MEIKTELNEWMNKWGFRPHLCTYRLNWVRKTYPVGEMTLPFRHMIRNSSSGGLRPSTLPLGRGGSPQYWIFTSERRRNIFLFKTWRPEWGSSPRSPTFQAASFIHSTRAPAMIIATLDCLQTFSANHWPRDCGFSCRKSTAPPIIKYKFDSQRWECTNTARMCLNWTAGWWS